MQVMSSLLRIPRAVQVIWICAIYAALIYFWLARGTAYEPPLLVMQTTIFGLVLASAPIFLITAREPRAAGEEKELREHREARLQKRLRSTGAHAAAEPGAETLRELPSSAERRGSMPITKRGVLRMFFGVFWAAFWLACAWHFSRPGMGQKNQAGAMIMFCFSALPFLLTLGESLPDSTREERRLRRSWRLKQRVKKLGKTSTGAGV